MSRHLQTLFHFNSASMQLGRFTNPYILHALKTSLQAAECLRPPSHSSMTVQNFSADIEVKGDPCLYSVGSNGLGSSSALVSTIVSCVLRAFGVTDIGAVHLTSQLAHYQAEMKVRSM
jgi:phosphomevalonate kinase